ncbi:MAG: hypothetical protein WDO56_09530 [Gammaproteobacteria bacterium]
MRFDYSSFATDGVLASAQLGKKVFGALASEIAASSATTLLYLDFQSVQVATTSFLREAVFTVRNHVRQNLTNIYPVAANLSAEIKEELGLFLRERGDAMATCNVNADEEASDPEVIGQLDGKLLMTLSAVLQANETDATTLVEQFADDERVGITAWNNRLAALAMKGLLIETIQGRAKRYRPVLENLKYGR